MLFSNSICAWRGYVTSVKILYTFTSYWCVLRGKTAYSTYNSGQSVIQEFQICLKCSMQLFSHHLMVFLVGTQGPFQLSITSTTPYVRLHLYVTIFFQRNVKDNVTVGIMVVTVHVYQY